MVFFVDMANCDAMTTSQKYPFLVFSYFWRYKLVEYIYVIANDDRSTFNLYLL